MPGDSRLVAAVRQLTAHAAGYAQLPNASRDDFAGHVERQANAAITASGVQDALIEFAFSGDESAVEVVISCEAATSPGAEWRSDGGRHICNIRQPLTA